MTYENAKKHYNRIRTTWDEAIEANDGETLKRLEDAFLDAEEMLREAFLNKVKREQSPKDYKVIKEVAWYDSFIETIAR